MLTAKKLFAVMVLSVMPALAWANGKIVALDVRAAVMGTTAAQAKFDKMQKGSEYAATKAKVDALQADMKALQTSFQKDGMTWSEEKRAESEKKMQSLGADYQFQGKKLQADQQAAMQEVMQEMAPKLDAAIKQLIEAENIGLVVDASALIAAKPEANITAKVTELLNKAK